MITEDYVSYEVAKLLKQKGFDEELEKLIRPDGKRFFLDQHSVSREKHCTIKNSDINRYDDCVSCPTHQMAMKWLREIHHIHIMISIGFDEGRMFYHANFAQFEKDRITYGNPIETDFSTCEEAVEAALKYSLENLI